MDVKVEEVKFVINGLNDLLNKKLTLVSYDSLKDEQRIDLLLQVFKQIDPMFDLTELASSDPEEVVVKVLEMLRIFKYQPPQHLDSESFRSGILNCDKNLVTHILNYLLDKREELKKRAYLARYLVRIEVSPEVEGDNDIVTLYQQYDKLIESFKQVHSTNENLKKSVKSVQELSKDIRSMESEKDQLNVKLSTVKRKTDPSANLQLFNKVKSYREEKDKNEKLIQQNVKQISQLEKLKTKSNELNGQLRESSASIDSTANDPQILLDKLNDELKTKNALITSVLPKEISHLDQYIANLHELDDANSVSGETLNRFKQQANRLSKEINSILEKKMLRQEQSDDKIRIFQQNSQEISAKRIATEKKLMEVENELNRLQRILEEKRAEYTGKEILKGDALKQFVNLVKNKGNKFKKSKIELNEIRTERGILARSLDLLQAKEKDLADIVNLIEEEKGISGYFTMKEELKKNREVSGHSSASKGDIYSASDSMTDTAAATLEELTTITKKLNDAINAKKSQLAPIIKDLRPLRQRAFDLQQETDNKKSNYDSTAATLESNLAKLENEVKRLSDEKESLESKEFKMKCELEIVSAYEDLIKGENQLTVTVGGRSDSIEAALPRKGLIANLEFECNEQRQMQEQLKNQQRFLKENEDAIKRQVKLWKDLKVLFEVKKSCIEKNTLAEKTQMGQENAKLNHLVL